MFQKKPSASEVDGVQYRRAKTWQIICYACNAFVGMSVYSLIGMASYSASIGYGITTATVGIILMLARILDGFTDPLLAFVYDRVNTRFGKLRVLLISGYLIEAVGLLCMFNLFSSKGFGLPAFVLTYIIYIIGTISNKDVPRTPQMQGSISKTAYFSNVTEDMLQKERNQILGAQKEDIQKLAALVEAVLSDDQICVVGSETAIEKAENVFMEVKPLIG